MTTVEFEPITTSARGASPTSDSIELRVPSKPEYVAIVRSLITDIARRFSMSEPEVMDLKVAASEACSNVVRHAYEDTADGGIFVRCSSARGELVIEVADAGRGFDDIHSRLRKRIEIDGGLGLELMGELMDDVSLNTAPERGTTVRMTKRLP